MIQNYNPCLDCELNTFDYGCIASLFASRVGLPPLHPDNCETAKINTLRFSSQMNSAIRDFEYEYDCSLTSGVLF